MKKQSVAKPSFLKVLAIILLFAVLVFVGTTGFSGRAVETSPSGPFFETIYTPPTTSCNDEVPVQRVIDDLIEEVECNSAVCDAISQQTTYKKSFGEETVEYDFQIACPQDLEALVSYCYERTSVC